MNLPDSLVEKTTPYYNQWVANGRKQLSTQYALALVCRVLQTEIYVTEEDKAHVRLAFGKIAELNNKYDDYYRYYAHLGVTGEQFLVDSILLQIEK